MAKCNYSRCKKPVAYRVEQTWMPEGSDQRNVHYCYDHIPGSRLGLSREELEKGNQHYRIQRVTEGA